MDAIDWLLDSDPAIRRQAMRDLTDAAVEPDERLDEAIEVVRSRRDANGRWPLENPHESEMVGTRVRGLGFDMGEREGQPSRWNTLRALRVLAWSEAVR